MVSHIDEIQCSLVELVVGTRNHKLYRKGEESRSEELNGRELEAQAFSPSKIIPIYERQSEPGETYENFKKRVITKVNPDKNVFNAYLPGEE